MTTRNLLIYNPVSGRNKDRENYLGKVVWGLTEKGNELTVYKTQGKGDARLYLENNSILYHKIICCGGDGTLHEIVNGMMNSGNTAVLGYIPMGSTNDYAKNIGISKENAIKFINENRTKLIDIGKMNGKYFNYVAAFGAFANVSFVTSQKVKNLFGYFAYILEGIKHLSEISPKHIRFQIDDMIIEDDIALGMITNAFTVAGFLGAGSKVTKLDDGAMEYLFVKMPQNLLDLQSIISSLLSEHIDDKFMYFGQAKKINLDSRELVWTLDGEDGGIHNNVEIEICPKAIEIIVGGNEE